MVHQPSVGYIPARLLALLSILLYSSSSSSDRSTGFVVVEGWLSPPSVSSSHLSRRPRCCSIQRRCGGGGGEKLFTPTRQLLLQKNGIRQLINRHNPNNKRTKTTATPTEIHFGLEDIVFHAENAAFSLANTVLNPSSSSTGADTSMLSTSSSATTSSLASLLSHNIMASVKSLLILYAAGVITSFSPCSLGLLPVTVSYISNAANERSDANTMLPTLAYAAGLALAFTTLGVSASVLGGVFGSSTGGGSAAAAGAGESLIPHVLATIGPFVSVLMGLQLLELIRIPLPSLDFKWRSSAVTVGSARGGVAALCANGNSGSLFDENGGLIFRNNMQGNNTVYETNEYDEDFRCAGPEGSIHSDEVAALVRMFLLGGTSALVASPCATPVLASLLAYLASMSSSSSSSGEIQSLGAVWKGTLWMLSYTLGYSTLLLVAGATGGQVLVNLRKARDSGGAMGGLWQWITPLTGGVLIAFGMNGLLVALLGDPSISALAPIIE